MLDLETSAFGAATLAIARRTFDVTISELAAETSVLGVAMSAIARSYRRYRRGVSSDIGDCGVGITPQMCNRVTNHRDMSTFSKPGQRQFKKNIYNLNYRQHTLSINLDGDKYQSIMQTLYMSSELKLKPH